MRGLVWRFVVSHLRKHVPHPYFESVTGDLLEDYEHRRRGVGRMRAQVWLIRETRSVTRAYRGASVNGFDATPPARVMLFDDLRHARRRIGARPGRALLCASLLAVGIGLTTVMFSVVDALLLQPAPFPGGDRLVRQTLFDSEPALMEAWRSSGMFEAVEAGTVFSFPLEPGGDSRWPGASVTPGAFALLGARPLHGRTFIATDGSSGARDEVVLSEVIWRTIFGSDPAIVGRRISVDNAAFVVVGIMPATFRFPTPATVLWKPLFPAAGERGPFTLFGRLKPGVPLDVAEDRTKALAWQLARLPRNYGGPPLGLVGDAKLSAFTRRALWLLLAGVGIVFLVLCANVTSLLLANLSARQREFGMCTALGASRMRLVREASAEHALIGLAGALLGVALAWGFTSVVPRVFEGHSLNAIDIDLRALLTASGLGLTAVILTGIIPAWMGTRSDPMDSLRGSRQTSTETRATRVVTHGLLVGQAGLACSLLVGSALLVRSFTNMVEADRGLNSDGAIRVSVGGMDDAFGSGDAMARAAEAIEERFSAWPEITQVALSRELPPLASTSNTGGHVHLGAPGTKPDPSSSIQSDVYRVNRAFFDFYGITIVRGRTFDTADTEREVIAGERLTNLLWPGQDPIGRTFSVGSQKEPRRVVGVAREIRLPTLDPELDRPEYYTPLGRTSRTLFVNLRCRATCPSERDIRAQVQSVHPGLRARLVPAAEDVYLNQLQLPRATAQVGGVSAVIALLTAAGGLFSVLTYTVGSRRREFGIRTALGASPGQVRRLVLRAGMSLVGAGMALGVFGGWMVARSLVAFQYGVSTTDPLTWGSVVATLTITSLAAAWRPARQAMRVDPVTLLREE
jgi:putative ABC transport system permease protein